MPTLRYIGSPPKNRKVTLKKEDRAVCGTTESQCPVVTKESQVTAKRDVNAVEDEVIKKLNILGLSHATVTQNEETVKNDVTTETSLIFGRSPTKSPCAKAHKGVAHQRASLADVSQQPKAQINRKPCGLRVNSTENTKCSSSSPKLSLISTAIPHIKKAKNSNDPSAPRRFKSSYMFYQAEIRSQIKSEFPGISFGESSKISGERWRCLTTEQKTKYDCMMMEDRERYYTELKLYQAKLMAENSRLDTVM